MLSKFLTATALGAALIATPVLAQSKNSPSPSTSASSTSSSNTAQTASASGLWQGSKLIGVNVYNDKNEKIGDIKQLMVDKQGKIESVVIGVGGFLGMGERDVAVKFSELKWSDQPVSSSSSSTKSSTTGAGNSSSSSSGPKTYPDHAVFNATKDQLKAMPQFDYNK